MSDTSAPAATAARAIAAALLRHALTAAGTALVAHGYVDQDTANSAVGPIAEELLGLGITIGAASWSAIRARISHTRWANAWAALRGDQPAESIAPATKTPPEHAITNKAA